MDVATNKRAEQELAPKNVRGNKPVYLGDDNLTLAQRLQKLRGRAGLTNRQLAARSTVDNGTISNLELGKSKEPTLSNGLFIAHGLGVDPWDLIGRQRPASEKPVPLSPEQKANYISIELPDVLVHLELSVVPNPAKRIPKAPNVVPLHLLRQIRARVVKALTTEFKATELGASDPEVFAATSSPMEAFAPDDEYRTYIRSLVASEVAQLREQLKAEDRSLSSQSEAPRSPARKTVQKK